MTDAEKREKVIKGLKYLHDVLHWSLTECEQDTMIRRNITAEAIAMLKAHEPRLLTEDDFENNPEVDHDGFLPAWIEYRRGGDWDEYWEGQPDEWGVCRADRLVYETMRYWTSRPTDAQKEATPWE